MTGLKGQLRAALKFLGKGEEKAAAVFGTTPRSSHAAVLHLRRGAPGLPVYLFSTEEPPPETAALCAEVHVRRSGLVLFLHAEAILWRRWVAISAGTWTGEHGGWAVKLAPLLIPPFHALLLNRHGDFFPGTPAQVWRHYRRLLRDVLHSGGHRAQDIAAGCWYLISTAAWRSGPCTRVKDVGRGLARLFAVRLQRGAAAPGRGLFRLMQGNESLTFPAAGPPAGDGVLCVRRAASGWDGEALEAAARASTARWILWQEGNAGEQIDELLPLFDTGRTFAAARQRQFRGWKTGLFATAPFRVLQAGEASQVLAPLSDTILVERRKLLALGVPRVRRADTAWRLLFWKAAAAGWRSYSVGQQGESRQEPDAPVEETAFLVRALADRQLRRLGAREPDLARGNIAFTPQRQQRGADRLTVLLVSPFLPYPLAHGGAVRIYNLCRALSGRVDFILAAIRETRDVTAYDKLREICREVRVIDIDEPAAKEKALPRQVREHRSRSLRALLAELCRTAKPDLLQVEYTHMAAFRESAPAIPALLVEHDITFQLYRQLAATNRAAHAEYERWLRFERHWLGRYDAVWTVSEDDRRTAVGAGSRPERTFVVANGVDVSRFVPCAEAAGAVPEVLYVGSFRHLPNLVGFEKLCREVMPRVWSRCPEVRLRVVAGPEHERYWQDFGSRGGCGTTDPRVTVHGFVEDLRPLYAGARAVAVPLEVSAGTNIKVLEAMACGKPVVSTPVGCAGLGLRDGHDALVRASWAEFADCLCQVLSDPLLRRGIAEQARRTAERYSWAAIAETAYRSYEQIAEARSARALRVS